MSPGVLSAIVLAAGSLVAVLVTTQQNRRGAKATEALENRKVDVSVFKDSLAELRTRLSEVEDSLQHERDQRRLSNQYARTLAQILRENGMPVPQPPDGLDLP